MIELPELITDKAVNLEKKYQLSDVMANEIVKARIDFEEYVNKSQPAPSSFGAILKGGLQEKLNGQAKLAEAEKAEEAPAEAEAAVAEEAPAEAEAAVAEEAPAEEAADAKPAQDEDPVA